MRSAISRDAAHISAEAVDPITLAIFTNAWTDSSERQKPEDLQAWFAAIVNAEVERTGQTNEMGLLRTVAGDFTDPFSTILLRNAIFANASCADADGPIGRSSTIDVTAWSALADDVLPDVNGEQVDFKSRLSLWSATRDLLNGVIEVDSDVLPDTAKMMETLSQPDSATLLARDALFRGLSAWPSNEETTITWYSFGKSARSAVVGTNLVRQELTDAAAAHHLDQLLDLMLNDAIVRLMYEDPIHSTPSRQQLRDATLVYNLTRAAIARFRYPFSPEDLQDMTQSTLLKARRAARNATPHPNPAAWIWIIARNVVYDWFRQNKGARAVNKDVDTDWIGGNLPPLSDALLVDELMRCLRNTVFKLMNKSKQTARGVDDFLDTIFDPKLDLESLAQRNGFEKDTKAALFGHQKS